MWIKIKTATNGHVGYTDGAEVFIADTLKTEEHELVLVHEKAHVLLQHHHRSRKIEKIDHRLWNVACDIEIAKHIYTSKDEEVITAIRSNLKCGITSEHAKQYPTCTYAEEFYDILKQKQDQKDKELEDAFNAMSDEEKKEVAKIVATGRATIAEERQAETTRQYAKNFSAKNFKLKPSLAGVIDTMLPYSRIARRKTYARVARKSQEPFFAKGVKHIRKIPKILIYVDCSGSFTPEKTRVAREALDKILVKYRSSIKADVRYFSDEVSASPIEGGGTNYLAVLEDVMEHRPEISIVLTDDDSNHIAEGYTGHLEVTEHSKLLVIPIGCATTWLAGVVKGARESQV